MFLEHSDTVFQHFFHFLGRLLCTQCQVAMYPDAQGYYEFEGFRPMPASGEDSSDAKKKDVPEEDDDGVLDLLDMEIPEEQEEAIKKTLEEKTKYKEVAPTWELVRISCSPLCSRNFENVKLRLDFVEI